MARVAWCFTSFQDTLTVPEDVRYVVYQRERCPDSGREHFQGYIEFKRKLRLNAAKRAFDDDSIHLEPRRGTREQARDYCRKEATRIDGPWESGDFGVGGSGRRSDLVTIVERLRDNPRELGELSVEFPGSYCSARGGLRDIAAHLLYREARQFRSVKTLVLHGDGGVGKTSWAVRHYPNSYRLTQPDSQLWWDGYNGEETLIIDDFYGWIKWGMFLVLLDGYSVRLPVKGGHTWALWDRIIITSNALPDSWYEAHTLGDEQFNRRLHAIVRMVGPDEYDVEKGGDVWDDFRANALTDGVDD